MEKVTAQIVKGTIGLVAVTFLVATAIVIWAAVLFAAGFSAGLIVLGFRAALRLGGI